MLADADTVGSLKSTPRINDRLEEVLEQFLAVVRVEFGNSACAVVDELTRLVFAGGKRLRPTLCCLGFSAAGENPTEPIIKAAVSLELLHTLAIVHDDLMDGSSRRRGAPTTMHSTEGQGPSGLGAAASMAVLVGDLALVLSDRLFMESGCSADSLARAWRPLNQLRQDAIAGQFLDISAPGTLPELKAAETIAHLKTGSYSMKGPLLVGAALAGAPANIEAALAAYGDAAGLAFQYTDDLFGLFGEPANTGKDIDSDIRLGKPTRLVARAAVLASPGQKQTLAAIFGNREASSEELEQVRRIVIDCGAKKDTIEEAGRLFQTAIDAVNSDGPLNPETGRALTIIADGLRFRES